MDIELLKKKFGRMGARVKVREASGRGNDVAGIDIGSDRDGEFFDIRLGLNERVDYDVVDIRPRMRHLLLMARRDTGKEKFLCGHDERHWFVCAVPGNGVVNVRGAMEALQPPEVRAAIAQKVRRPKNRLRRHNEAFIRQGEWFFIPVPQLVVNPNLIFRNEPISRGRGSKPHMCQYLYRTGGEIVMVCRRYPSGVTSEQYKHILRSNPKAKGWDWRSMRRNAGVYVRGRIWHSDHQTIVLTDWHRVLMNTENMAPGSRSVVFLD